jgi:S1-C subfamily serine protease
MVKLPGGQSMQIEKNTRRNKKLLAFLMVIVMLISPLACINLPDPFDGQFEQPAPEERVETVPPSVQETQQALPTLPPNENGPAEVVPPTGDLSTLSEELFINMYEQLNPGVVNITTFRGGSGGQGSGFIIDDQGHIVTNRHVIASADIVTVIFYNTIEAYAEVIGVDPDSDLAILRVEDMPEDVYPLSLGDSDEVQVGELVIAIGNPFGLGSSMTLGIVSAVGRSIASGATPFSIPQAIQTDAAINPGNSGGPLINLRSEIIGVNAQIATAGTPANVGVGFAIPSNVVRRIAPALIETGAYHWPYLGVEGGNVNLSIQQANDLPTQSGVYISRVTPDSPADRAGLRGTTGTTTVNGIGGIPTGGDVIIEANGMPVLAMSDLLVAITSINPGDTLDMTIIRDGQEMQVQAELVARPSPGGS